MPGLNVKYGQQVKIRHVKTGNRLHSHEPTYPGGSKQQQVTCFSGHDDNDWFLFKGKHGTPEHHHRDQPVKNGDIIRLEHHLTQRNLHSHNISADGHPNQHEVSCYKKNQHGDVNDDWRIECPENILHMESHFKLVHVATGYTLHSMPKHYSFKEQNIVAAIQGSNQTCDFVVEEIRGLPGGGKGQQQGGGGGGGGGGAIQYGEHVKLVHTATQHRLHSHAINYPNGSKQQQVTCYEGKDDNDFFFFKGKHGTPENKHRGHPVKNGDIVRLQHVATSKNLHSHTIKAHATPDQHEVTCYGVGAQGDHNDDWRVECQGVLNQGEKFRLIHVATNHALHSHNKKYRFIDQQEVTGFGSRDDNDFFKIGKRLNNAGGGGGGGGHGGHGGSNPMQQIGQAMAGMMQPGVPNQVITPGGYPPQAGGYPPAAAGGYPPQAGGYPPQAGYPPPAAAVPFQLPPPGSKIHLESVSTGKNLKLAIKKGIVEGTGGRGDMATFVVAPNNGYMRLQCQADPNQYLAVRKSKLDLGPGGAACELVINPIMGDIVSVAHAHGHGCVGFSPDGTGLDPQTVNPGAGPAGQFRIKPAN